MTRAAAGASIIAGMPQTAREPPSFSRRPGERWTEPAERIANAFGLVLVLVLVTYVLASVTPYHGWTAVPIAALTCASATLALATAGIAHRFVRWAGRLSALAVLLAAIAAASDDAPPLALSALLQTALLAAAAFAVLRAVISEAEVGFRTILGAISVYLIFALLFTSLYVGLDRLQPGPLFGSSAHLGTGDYLFFSLTTLTTTGYGNLVPAGQPGKMFAGLEMLLGQIFLVTMIAGLVSLWRPGEWVRSKQQTRGEPPPRA